jgi:hypothetical protein
MSFAPVKVCEPFSGSFDSKSVNLGLKELCNHISQILLAIRPFGGGSSASRLKKSGADQYRSSFKFEPAIAVTRAFTKVAAAVIFFPDEPCKNSNMHVSMGQLAKRSPQKSGAGSRKLLWEILGGRHTGTIYPALSGAEALISNSPTLQTLANPWQVAVSVLLHLKPPDQPIIGHPQKNSP